MKIRIKFKKTGSMKFVGHLDTMRYFQRAIRRAGIDIAYTTGFSPHPIMSFALPLGVGVESEGEYFDIKVKSSLSSKKSIDLLNSQMAEGIEILSYRKLPENEKKSMSLVEAADYILSLREGYKFPENFSAGLKEFYSQQEIKIIKQTKKSERILDLKPLIFKMETDGNNIFMRLKAGSVDNVKPNLVLEAFYKYLELSLPPFAYAVKRLDLYTIKKTDCGIKECDTAMYRDKKTVNENSEFLSLSLTGEDVL